MTASPLNVDDDAIAKELEDLAQRHDMYQLTSKNRKNRLQPRHVAAFGDDSFLFDKFARVVCSIRAIPRKELFEAWAMALYVTNHFPKATRSVDLASGHGLLSWAILYLLETNSHSSIDNTADRRLASVVCIDKRMPPSAEKLADAMLKEFPQYKGQWDYVEAKLECIQASNSTVLVGVHCCGVLSDKVVELALLGNSPIALVPCCHEKNCLTAKEHSHFLLEKKSSPSRSHNEALADFIDHKRIERLKERGFDVVKKRIPKVFTPKNRILLATPSSSSALLPSTIRFLGVDKSERFLPRDQREAHRVTSQIPVEDTPAAREHVRSISGRIAADTRKKPPTTTICISLIVPSERHLRLDDVRNLVSALDKKVLKVIDEEPFLHPSGKLHQTFRFSYQGMSKREARSIRAQLCDRIFSTFPHATIKR